jgi:hypothetical protein
MEVLIGFGVGGIQLLTSLLMTGRASLSVNIKFWPWFVVGLFLPFISVVLIFCRPIRGKKVQQPLLKPVSSEEIFDQAMDLEKPRRINGNGIQFLARA